jgi:hypothetical protein
MNSRNHLVGRRASERKVSDMIRSGRERLEFIKL